jgi:hypothetical protein
MILPLTLGALSSDGVAFRRSGIQWLRGDGEFRAGEVLGYCNITLDVVSPRHIGAEPFADEHLLQVAFAPRIGGRLRVAEGASKGGYLDVLPVLDWDPTDLIASIETTGDETAGGESDAEIPRRLMLAGRRMGWAVDIDVGLLPGWHRRARGWWDAPAGRDMPTMLVMGVCDANSVVRGDRSGFVEMFEAAPFPAHMITASENPMAACAPVVLDQLERSPSDRLAIRADMARALSSGVSPPTADDYLFMGAVLAQLEPSPIRESSDIMTPDGLIRKAAPDVIMMSLSAEPRSVLTHRRLGYRLNIMNHNQRPAGPAARDWLRSAFDRVPRDLDDIQRDYARLFGTVHSETGAHFLIVNRMSTSGEEDLSSYAAFDAPMGDTLASISAKEMNLMLDDLSEEHGMDVIDVDAIAADLGGAEHLPDGIHQSRAMQSALRADILNRLAALAQPTSGRDRLDVEKRR